MRTWSRRSVVKAGLIGTGGVLLAPLANMTGPAVAQASLPSRLVRRFGIGGGAGQVGTILGAGLKPLGPESLRVDDSGGFVLTDTINRRVHRWSEGGALMTIATPAGARPVDVLDVGDRSWILDSFRDRAVLARGKAVLNEFPVSTIVVGKTTRLSSATATSVEAQIAEFGTIPLVSDLTAVAAKHDGADRSIPATMRTSAEEQPVRMEFSARPGDRSRQATLVTPGQPSLAIKATGRLLNARYLGTDRHGRRYILVQEELAPLTATATVWRASGAHWDATAEMPLEGLVFVPSNALALAPDGRVFALNVGRSAIDVLELAFVPRPVAIARIEARAALLQSGFAFAAVPPPAPGTFSASRAEAINHGDAYYSTSWWCNQSNYATCSGTCRPGFMTAADQWYYQVPYQWGGWVTINQFITDMNNNKTAGDVCVGPIAGCASGVDCSGYLQQCWGLSSTRYIDTGLVDNFCTQITDWYALQPGDAIDLYNQHIAMNHYNVSGGCYVYEAVGDDGRVLYHYYDFAAKAAQGFKPYRCNILS